MTDADTELTEDEEYKALPDDPVEEIIYKCIMRNTDVTGEEASICTDEIMLKLGLLK